MKSALQNKHNKIILILVGLFIIAAAIVAVKTWLDTRADLYLGDEQIQGVGTEVMGVGTEVMNGVGASVIQGVGTEVMNIQY